MEISSEQIRAARALLRLEQREIAERARVSIATIRRLERRENGGRVAPDILSEVRNVLEQAGAEFIADGVRRRRAARRDARACYADLREISRRSAARLQGRALLADTDLYDENGLPA